jgi:error-prone DNA polymerase
LSHDLKRYFLKSVPNSKPYLVRYEREMALIQKFGFAESFIQVREILDLVPEYRFITRGSAGCSLVCYLMGIHDMDPVENNFVLSRFMHENRPDSPDIDVDFAYNQRDRVIELVRKKYPGRVARISNHVLFRENSAIRHSLREHGNRKFMPRYFDFESVAGSRMDSIIDRAKELEGTFKNYSLHCGGIVIFQDAVPEHLKLNEDQIKLNKDEVEQQGLFKIDILCNRGLAQLNDLSTRKLEDYPEYDEATANLFQSGNTWGVTFGESPAQRRLHVDVRPNCRKDVIFSLALIRPLPSADGRKHRVLEQFHRERNHRGQLIYDDDGILYIQKLLNCSESEAELYRKAFGKKNQTKIDEFAEKIKYHPDRFFILKELGYFSLYSFCHAHATSYGNLVWALAYEKTRQPKKFWWSALNHAQSMYRPWVHVQEAKKAGLKFMAFGRGPWKMNGDELRPEFEENSGDGWHQYKKRGYWISNRFMPGMFSKWNDNYVQFKGLIATGRHHTVNGRKITFITIGTSMNHYYDLVLDGIHQFDKYDIIEGEGLYSNRSIQCSNHKFITLNKNPSQKMLFDV